MHQVVNSFSVRMLTPEQWCMVRAWGCACTRLLKNDVVIVCCCAEENLPTLVAKKMAPGKHSGQTEPLAGKQCLIERLRLPHAALQKAHFARLFFNETRVFFFARPCVWRVERHAVHAVLVTRRARFQA